MNDDPQPTTDEQKRLRVMFVACTFEAGLGVLAIAVGWLFGADPLLNLKPNWADAGLGLLAAVPMLLVFAILLVAPMQTLREIVAFLDEQLVPYLRPCTVVDLAILSVLAGWGEELLFRGLIQPALAAGIGPPAGLVLASIIFGIAHWITPTYLLLATTIGFYLGWLFIATGNLLVPAAAHAAYDFAALMYYIKFRRPPKVDHDQSA